MVDALSYRANKPYSAPPFALLHPEESEVVTLGVPGYRQSRNYSCGFASVLMVLRYFEVPLAGQALFEALGTNHEGTGQSAIVRVLRQEGITANIRYDMGFDIFARTIDDGKVLISYLEDEGHWLVLYGYGLQPERIYAADPEPPKKCEYFWSEYGARLGGFGIVCSQKRKDPTSGQLSFDFVLPFAN